MIIVNLGLELTTLEIGEVPWLKLWRYNTK